MLPGGSGPPPGQTFEAAIQDSRLIVQASDTAIEYEAKGTPIQHFPALPRIGAPWSSVTVNVSEFNDFATPSNHAVRLWDAICEVTIALKPLQTESKRGVPPNACGLCENTATELTQVPCVSQHLACRTCLALFFDEAGGLPACPVCPEEARAWDGGSCMCLVAIDLAQRSIQSPKDVGLAQLARTALISTDEPAIITCVGGCGRMFGTDGGGYDCPECRKTTCAWCQEEEFEQHQGTCVSLEGALWREVSSYYILDLGGARTPITQDTKSINPAVYCSTCFDRVGVQSESHVGSCPLTQRISARASSSTLRVNEHYSQVFGRQCPGGVRVTFAIVESSSRASVSVSLSPAQATLFENMTPFDVDAKDVNEFLRKRFLDSRLYRSFRATAQDGTGLAISDENHRAADPRLPPCSECWNALENFYFNTDATRITRRMKRCRCSMCRITSVGASENPSNMLFRPAGVATASTLTTRAAPYDSILFEFLKTAKTRRADWQATLAAVATRTPARRDRMFADAMSDAKYHPPKDAQIVQDTYGLAFTCLRVTLFANVFRGASGLPCYPDWCRSIFVLGQGFDLPLSAKQTITGQFTRLEQEIRLRVHDKMASLRKHPGRRIHDDDTFMADVGGEFSPAGSKRKQSFGDDEKSSKFAR